MFETTILFKILLSTVLGAIIGLETETREIEKKGAAEKVDERSRIGGVRTYTLISLLGGIAGLFYFANEKTIAVVLFLSIILFLLIAYYLNIQLKKAFGLTTEIAILITFISGFLITSAITNVEVVLFVLVLLSFFLSNKRGIGKIISKIQHYEVIDLIKFGLVSLVILPLLPNKDIYVNDILSLFANDYLVSEQSNLLLINPFQIWLIVVIISSISIGSYLISKVFGEKNGLVISSFFSGLVSSTSSIIAFASQSKTNKGSSQRLAGASLISNATSFITVVALITVSNPAFSTLALPVFLVLFISSLILGLYFLLSQDGKSSVSEAESSFTLWPALKFVGIIIVLKIFVQLVINANLGNGLLVAGTALSAVTGIDAPLIATATLVLDGIITPQVGILIAVLANSVNYIAKMFYARTSGSTEFFKLISFGLIVSLISSFIMLLVYVL